MLEYPVDERGYTDERGMAQYTATSRSKLAKDRHFGVGIPFVKHGRSVRYSFRAADQHLAASRKGEAAR